MAETQSSVQRNGGSPWVILEWFFMPFRARPPYDQATVFEEFGLGVAVYNMDARSYRRNAVRMPWPPTPQRTARARRRLWEWIGQLETDPDGVVTGAKDDEVLEGNEIRPEEP